MQHRHPLVTIVAVLLASCVSANVPDVIADAIPANAKVIRLYSDQAPADFYAGLYHAVAAEGFRIAQSDQGMGNFATDFKDIGQGTTLRMDVLVSPRDSGSIAVLRGQWGLTTTMAVAFSGAFGASAAGGSAESVNWGGSGRPKAAFGEMAVIAGRLPHRRIEYAEH